MTAMTSAHWIDALDRSQALAPMLRPAALLDSVRGQHADHDSALLWPVGRRDAHLLDLIEALLGPQMQAVTRCPQCHEPLELSLHTADLRLPDRALPSPLEVVHGDHLLRARLPNSHDLAHAAQAPDLATARRLLRQACVVVAQQNGRPVPVDTLPDAVMEQLDQAMNAADPQAQTELNLLCPACAHQWHDLFDVASFLLDSLEHWAERCLDQVHTLAQAYGWSEAQILALSPARRARYLERVLA